MSSWEHLKAKGLHICHLNVSSLWNKFELIKQQIANSNISIFCISESWLNPHITSEMINIPGYSLTRLDRSWSNTASNNIAKGGGLCIYIKNGITFSTTEFDKFNKSAKDIECQWISLNQKHQRKIIIINTYRCPSGNTKAFTDYLTDNINLVTNRTNYDIFLLGDMNINYRSTHSPDRKHLKDMERLTSLKQLIHETTRYSHNDSTLDLIFTNSEYILNCGTVDLNISDHECIFVTRKKKKEKVKRVTFEGRSYKHYNRDQFQANLINENWTPFYLITDPNHSWEFMKNLIKRNIDRMCPVKIMNVKERLDPWINDEILELIKDKDIALAKAKKTKSSEDWTSARYMRNLTNKMIKNAKSEFIKENLNKYEYNSKKFWENIKHLVPNKHRNNNTLYLKDKSTNEAIDNEDTANFINNFFISVGPELDKNFDTTWHYDGQHTNAKFTDITAAQDEVVTLCNEINIYKSSAILNLSSRILKDAFLAVPGHLTHLFNLSLGSGSFPDDWKIATVIPLPKEGDPSDVNNLRPISLLPLPGKILEKIVHKQFLNYFENNNFISTNQGGFRPNHSTIDTVGAFTDDIFDGINDKKFTIAAFIDLKKAFDTVNYDILIKKLHYLGVRNKPLDWIKDYQQSSTKCINTTAPRREHVTVSMGK